jgi:hypothetical protein
MIFINNKFQIFGDKMKSNKKRIWLNILQVTAMGFGAAPIGNYLEPIEEN